MNGHSLLDRALAAVNNYVRGDVNSCISSIFFNNYILLMQYFFCYISMQE